MKLLDRRYRLKDDWSFGTNNRIFGELEYITHSNLVPMTSWASRRAGTQYDVKGTNPQEYDNPRLQFNGSW
jgi:hypothetical protein